MKIVKPYARIVNPETANGALRTIEYAARISHRSEEDMTETSTERFMQSVIVRRGDWSVTEHIQISVEMVVDRGITHEIVRHRIASYTQESTRFVNYVKKMPPSFIYPKPGVECPLCLSGDEPLDNVKNNGNWTHVIPNNYGSVYTVCSLDPEWLDSIQHAESSYKQLLAKGWRPQEARSVFPNALASKILVTMNIRSWRHFFLMRTTKEAHPQIREVAIPLLQEFKCLIPVLYDDIEPEMSQMSNITKGR